jgi:hypothetical protein
MLHDTEFIQNKLLWMRTAGIWPNGKRYLWTDAFGVILLVSLYEETKNADLLTEAKDVVAEVDRVLGRPKGYRIGEDPDRDGQYFHYLAMWIFALTKLGKHFPEYKQRAIRIVKDIHPHFVVPGRGVIWKMQEDLSAVYPGYGWGAIDPFHGLVVYRLLDETALANEIADMRRLVLASYDHTYIDQDLGLGMMLWLCHFFPSTLDFGSIACIGARLTYWCGFQMKPGPVCKCLGVGLRSPRCGSIRLGTIAVALEQLASSLHSRTTGFPLVCKRKESTLIMFKSSTRSSVSTATEIDTTRMPLRM